MEVPTKPSEIVSEYTKAFRAVHGRYPRIKPTGNGRFWIEDSEHSYARSDLIAMTETLRNLAKTKGDG